MTNEYMPEKWIPFYQPRKADHKVFYDHLEEIIKSNRFSNSGPKVREFENKIARLLNVKHCIAVCNGTIGLQLALSALNLKGEVLTTPFTFIATANAIKWHGLKPVFCDIDPRTLTISTGEIKKKITPRTSAILGVHVYGQPCHVEAIEKIANENNLKVIYDGAHSFLTSVGGVPITQFGEVTVLSFHATKIFHTFEGGALLTNNSELAKKLSSLKNFGFNGLDWLDSFGINAKMNEVSAAYGLSMLDGVHNTVEKFSAIKAIYRSGLKPIKGIGMYEYTDGVISNNQYQVLFIDETCALTRDQLWAWLWNHRVECRRYFYPGVHLCKPYSMEQPYLKGTLPVTENVASQVLCLPCYYDLPEMDCNRIVQLITHALEHPREVTGWFENFLAGENLTEEIKPVYEALIRERDHNL